jgi:hypothetical protein
MELKRSTDTAFYDFGAEDTYLKNCKYNKYLYCGMEWNKSKNANKLTHRQIFFKKYYNYNYLVKK